MEREKDSQTRVSERRAGRFVDQSVSQVPAFVSLTSHNTSTPVAGAHQSPSPVRRSAQNTDLRIQIPTWPIASLRGTWTGKEKPAKLSHNRR